MRTTIIIQILVVLFIAGGFTLLTRDLLTDLEFQSFQAAEVVMIDTANILAAEVESASSGSSRPRWESFAPSLQAAANRRFSARVFHLERQRVGLTVHVTDRDGIVLFDSDGGKRTGRDFSNFRDVALTLDGRYGARSTRVVADQPGSSVLHVAAPIRDGETLIGVLVVAMPQAEFAPFIRARVQRTLWSAALIGSGVIVLALAVFFWLLRPIRRLTRYAEAIRQGRRAALPPLGKGREATTLGAAMEAMREELEGRAYAENYVRTLAHEMKSPLAAIRGAGELLQEESMPAGRRRQFLDNILRETDRSESLIRQLLELARLEGRPALATADPIDLAALAGGAIDAARPRAEAAGLTIDWIAPASAGPEFSGDAFALRTAFSNLLENAIAHSPPGGRVACAVATSPGEWVFSVRDHGPGLPDYALDRAFERFFSLPQPGTGRKGTGLGLAFVREAAHLHHGTVTLENHPDGGALATFRLPL